MNQQHHQVRIHIDHEPYFSPSPTTGAALYALGVVDERNELFREIDGNREDELIPRGEKDILLSHDEHFYSQRDFNVVINTEARQTPKRRLTFDDVVKLSGEEIPPGPNILTTIDYSNGPHRNPRGSLRKGQTVVIRDGMEFDVSTTDRS